ncbi:MAG: AAA family ATPase [Candidatus Firestonebacteria bacterium]
MPRIFTPPEGGYFLFGPRGTGKTTYLKQKYQGALWFDLLEPDLFRQLSARPERFKEIFEGEGKKVVVVDEIQKIPELIDVIHKLIEENKDVKFILTGSSARKLKRTGAGLLGGRLLKQSLHPFMACELGELFKLEQALETGLVPVVYSSTDRKAFLRAYAAMYIKEEVQAEGLVRNIGNFARFLEAVSFSHGSTLNISNVSAECQVERKTVEGFLNIMEDLLIAYRIPVFKKKSKRITVSHPKFYLFDTGLFRVLRPSGPLDDAGSIEGAALEGLVAQHLISWCSYGGGLDNVYYHKTKSGGEVDSVIYGEKSFFAIEVKNSRRVRNDELRPLKDFISDYPNCKGLLLYRGKEKLKIGNIYCIPVSEFLKNLIPGKNPI